MNDTCVNRCDIIESHAAVIAVHIPSVTSCYLQAVEKVCAATRRNTP